MALFHQSEVRFKYCICNECNALINCHFYHKARQEKLLNILVQEIARATSQEKPLEIGSRLYPFSHTSAFQGPNSSGWRLDVGAPLPTTPPIDTLNSSASPPVGLNSVQMHMTSYNVPLPWRNSRASASQSPPLQSLHPSSNSFVQ